MERIIRGTLKFRVVVVAVFVAAAIVCLILSGGVRVNFNMVDYLPEKAPSTTAIDAMEAEYDTPVPNLRVMVKGVTVPEALEYNALFKALEGVSGVNWLDDRVDVRTPLAMQDEKTVADWYKDGNALFSIYVKEEGRADTLRALRGIIGDNGAMSGNPVDTAEAQSATRSEIVRMMMIIIPAAVGILLMTTISWAEPFILFVNLIIAIALNMGTNLIIGEVSFVTNTTGIVLQLACSIDYSIFLLDRFAELRSEGLEPSEAMAKAVVSSASSILASGMTTVIGFIALAAMQFHLGADMGVVLAKGILCSLLSTMLFLPSLMMYAYRLIDKTTHRSFMPSFKGFAKVAGRITTPVALCVAVLIVPCYLAGQNIDFTFGMSKMSAPDSTLMKERQEINEAFGESASFALLVPKGNMGEEIALADDIKALPMVKSVMSYVETVGNTIPAGFVPEDSLKMLNSDTYTRIVITASAPPESPEAFAFVETLRETAQRHYPDNYHLAGEIVNVYDMKETITGDSVKVNLISVGGIALVLLITFRSLSLPVLLLLTIESSIFINVSVPYFTGTSINYIGYLIISSVQLGATVDYAILFANRYKDYRVTMPAEQACRETIASTAGSILTSGGILTMAGFVLGMISSNMLISQLGMLLARGALLSTVLVLVFLPAMLRWLDPLIQKTTLGLKFL